MLNNYLIIKHSHLMFIGISVLLFHIRVYKLTRHPTQALGKMWRIAPHINDTLLLCTGLTMVWLANWSLLGWLGAKLILLIAYIIFGTRCLKSVPRSAAFWQNYALAVGVIGAMIYLAKLKPF